MSTDSPSEPQARRKPPITACLKVVSPEDIKLIQGGTSGDVKFKYVRHGLRIKTTSAADHKAATSLLQEKGVEFFTYNSNPGLNTKFIVKGPSPQHDMQRGHHGPLATRRGHQPLLPDQEDIDHQGQCSHCQSPPPMGDHCGKIQEKFRSLERSA